MNSSSFKRRMTKGGTLVVVVISALVLVIVGILVVLLTKIIGGGQEVQNAVDSGALDAAKTALVRPGYTPAGNAVDELQFTGVAIKDSNNPNGVYTGATADAKKPVFSLGNINRVWGQALLVSLNLKAMEAEGSVVPNAVFTNGAPATDFADQHTEAVLTAAKSINDKVADALTPVAGEPPQLLKEQFLSTANNNSLKMVSTTGDQVQISNGANIGYQDAQQASNVNIEDDQLANIVTDASFITSNTKPVEVDTSSGKKTKKFLTGYTDITIDAQVPNGQQKKIYFVPLKPDSRPHMISGMEFNANKPAITATAKPVNNSLFTKGKMKEEKSKAMIDFAAIALAEPVDQHFAVAIPHGYVKIVNWPGFDIHSTPLVDNQTTPPARGLHAAEYANHQLLEARSEYKGPSVNGDEFSQNMGLAYGILAVDSNNDGVADAPLKDNNGGILYVEPGDMSNFNPPMEQNPQVNGQNDDTCGGLIRNAKTGDAGRLPSGYECKDVFNSNGNGMNKIISDQSEYSVSVDGNGQIYATHGGEDPIQNEWILQRVAKANEDTQAYGSKNHPHIWSIDPAAVTLVSQSANQPPTWPNFASTAPNGWAWPNDDPWMYTGQMLMPKSPSGNFAGRSGVANQDPILFGVVGTIWDYLQDRPYAGATTEDPLSAPDRMKIKARLLQRILEIQPDFLGHAAGPDDLMDGSKLANLLNVQMNMGQDAYIFLDDKQQNPQMTCKVVNHNQTTGLSDWPWLQKQVAELTNHANYLYPPQGPRIKECLDGWGSKLHETMVYGHDTLLTTQPNSGPNFLENVIGDWAFATPYENADQPGGAAMNDIYTTNKYVFSPTTGYQGQLAVVFLETVLHHPGCQNPVPGCNQGPVMPGQVFNKPEDCPCVVFPVGSNVGVDGSSNCNPNTPPGWNNPNGNGSVPAAQGTANGGLPNCTHTGAC